MSIYLTSFLTALIGFVILHLTLTKWWWYPTFFEVFLPATLLGWIAGFVQLNLGLEFWKPIVFSLTVITIVGAGVALFAGLYWLLNRFTGWLKL